MTLYLGRIQEYDDKLLLCKLIFEYFEFYVLLLSFDLNIPSKFTSIRKFFKIISSL